MTQQKDDSLAEPTMTQPPKISVIMPAYMTAHLIARALDSVLQQTFRDFEIVVVNDGSPDTPELESTLAKYLDKIVYIKQENKRAAGARNTAIARAQGEFLAFLDSDDCWLPEHLACQMKLFELDPALDFVYSDGMVDTPEGSQKFTDSCPSRGEATFETLLAERCHIPVSTVVVRKAALARANFFDESLPRCDDYDMWFRTAFWGAKIGYSQNLQARFSGNRPGALSASHLKMLEAHLGILEMALRKLPLNSVQRESVRNRSCDIRALYQWEEGKVRIREGKFKEAAELISKSNARLQKPKLSLLLWGLKIAPGVTQKLIPLAQRDSR